MFAGDLAADNDGVVFDQRLHSHTGMQVIAHAVRNDGVADLIRDFVRMPAGNLFRCKIA